MQQPASQYSPPFKGLLRAMILPLLVLLFTFAYPATAADTNTAESTSSETTALNEETVRQVLIDLLNQGNPTANSNKTGLVTGDPASNGYESDAFKEWQGDGEVNGFINRVKQLFSKLPLLKEETKKAFAQTTSEEDGFGWTKVVLTIALACLLGLALEHLATHKLLCHLDRYVESHEKTTTLKIYYILLRTAIQILGFLALFLVIYICEILSLYDNPYYEALHKSILISLIYFRVFATVCANVYSPNNEEKRVVSLDSESARRLYRWSICFLALMSIDRVLISYLQFSDLDELLVFGITIPYSIVLNLILLSGAFIFKKEIEMMFVEEKPARAFKDQEDKQEFAMQIFTHIWPIIFAAWLTGIWGLYTYNNFMGNNVIAANISLAWWVTLLFPIFDRMVNSALKTIAKIEWLQSPYFERRASVFRRVILNGLRFTCLTFALVAALDAWGYNAGGMISMSMGSERLWLIVDILISVTVVYCVWTLISAYIERKLPVEETALANLEGDSGGQGATREETLLPLIRSTVNVVFFLSLILSVLSSMGVSIAPILAGAGVLGIALGFGAQKLVQDILSGMFFLIDDAFRRGEYIEIENLRGTVETISLRSMQLRHHLGAVQTIPYGEIKTVKNISRDWVTMKLELRLPYETDIEKVRKIIKKTGQKMLENEVFGKNFILPLKSQGVMRVEDSALIVRMKFTSKPGEQWVIRREAYRLVRDALEAEGIFFARREVRVFLPEHQNESPDQNGNEDNKADPNLVKAAGAAVLSVLAAEAAANAKIDDEGDMGDRD